MDTSNEVNDKREKVVMNYLFNFYCSIVYCENCTFNRCQTEFECFEAFMKSFLKFKDGDRSL